MRTRSPGGDDEHGRDRRAVPVRQFGGIEDTAAERSMHMFAREVLPVPHAMPAPLRDEHRPEPAVVASSVGS